MIKVVSGQEAIWTENFFIVSCVNLCIFLSFQMIFPVLPLYIKSLGGNDSIIGLVMGIFTISTLIARPVSGILLDRVGKKVVLLIGLVIFSLMVFMYGVVSSILMIIVIRLIHGFGWGFSGTATATIASEIIPKSRFAEGMGYFSLSNGLAMAFGPAVGIYISSVHGMRSVFYVAAVLAALSFVLGFFIKCKRHKHSLRKRLKAELYEKSAIKAAVLMYFLIFTLGSIVSYLPLYAYSKGIENIGVFFSVYAVIILITRPLIGKVIDRFGLEITMIPSFLLIVAAIITLSVSSSLYEFLGVAVLYGIGFGSLQTTLQTMAVRDVPHYRLGAANATLFSGLDLGMGTGVMILGVVANYWGYRDMYLFTLIPMTLSILFYVFYVRKRLKQSTLTKPCHK